MAFSLTKTLSSGIFVLRNQLSVLSCLLHNTPKSKLNAVLPKKQEIVQDYKKIEDEMSKKLFARVNEQIEKKSHGRLFAVVHIQGGQFKVTQDDIIVIRKSFAPTLGDKIRFEKVLLLGCSDFTLIGRPLLPLDQVLVVGTVIEKTLSHTIPYTMYRARKNDLKQHFYKDYLTHVRISSINLIGKVNELGDTDGLSERIF